MIVHANIFDPTKSMFAQRRNDRAQCQTIDCSESERCGLFRRGECVCRRMIGRYCPYGECCIEEGYTKKARKFREWINNMEKKYNGIPYLNFPSEKIAIIGEYIYLPYSHMDMKEDLFFRSDFVKKEDFNIENIESLISFHPRAMFTHREIEIYQKDKVPLFLLHLSEDMPSIYNELCNRNPELKKIVDNHSNIGRIAVLSTIKPNVGILVGIHGDEWIWDGEYLTMTNKKMSFSPVNHNEVRIRPVDGASIKVNSDDQVDEHTIFIN